MLHLFFTFFDMSLSLKQDCNDKVKTNGAFQTLSLAIALPSAQLQQLGGYEMVDVHSLQPNCNS